MNGEKKWRHDHQCDRQRMKITIIKQYFFHFNVASEMYPTAELFLQASGEEVPFFLSAVLLSWCSVSGGKQSNLQY